MNQVAAPQLSFWEEGSVLGGHPTESAYWRGSLASRAQSRQEQKRLGQFMTPAPIARFIAERMVAGRHWVGRRVRLLDPAAGSGVLAAALVEAALAAPGRPSCIELLMCELDPAMLALLGACKTDLEALCASQGVGFECRIQEGDFLQCGLARSGLPTVDAVIANPPYFKLAGHDERARAFGHAVHGQPNIYALFMASCASLLLEGGAFGFITPRSWTNGAYFRALRAHLFERLSLDGLHLFDSRESHFQADAVLQEALIAWATTGQSRQAIAVSSSHGASDLSAAKPALWPVAQVVGEAPDLRVSLPDLRGAKSLAGLSLRLDDLGLKVSTGAVIGFRAAAHLRSQRTATTVPMLWMPHVRAMQVEWPRSHRAEHIDHNQASAWMLLPNQPMVLMRRFSPKEDRRRITAAPYIGDLPGSHIGLENHLNVVHPISGRLSVDAARGLAAYLNSEPVNDHLRGQLGSTQVNAIEMRNLPVPDVATLEAIGGCLMSGAEPENTVSTYCWPVRSARSALHG